MYENHDDEIISLTSTHTYNDLKIIKITSDTGFIKFIINTEFIINNEQKKISFIQPLINW
jgi:hypothetical protein